MRKWMRQVAVNRQKSTTDQTMTSRPGPGHQPRKPSARRAASNSTDDVKEVGRESDVEESEKPKLSDRTKPPAYVAPIPKIGSIGSIPPLSSEIPTRPNLPPFVGSFLMGKPVDESGDIVDDKTGQVLARAGGDLPSIVGRRVSNRQGDILGDNGELLGYVADIEIERKGSASSAKSPGSMAPRSLFDIMSRSNASLMVDENGNILDGSGNVVGKFHDNNNPMHREARERQRQSQPPEESVPTAPPPAQEAPRQPETEQGQSRPRRTEEERRMNAEAWRKENPGESPSDIFLDVKSTTEGIQLTIRIPTVFGGQQVRPNISFS